MTKTTALKAEVKRLQEERRQVCQHLVGRDDCEDVPGVVAAVLHERMEAQRKAVEVKELQAIVEAVKTYAKSKARLEEPTAKQWAASEAKWQKVVGQVEALA
ncbi:unnamed protein product, partial [marine sediment metagenome]